MERVDCIYLAAGAGNRTGLGYTKQLWHLGGRPLFLHGLEVLAGMPEIRKIIVACPPDLLDDFAAIVTSYGYDDACVLVGGGQSRQESSSIALQHVGTDRVLVAEGARPFITPAFVRSILTVDASSVTPWMSSRASAVDAQRFAMPRRDLIGVVQTPQAFRTQLLRRAYEAVDGSLEEYTCDAHLVRCVTGVFPTLVQGIDQNIKVTTPLDLVIAQALFEHLRGVAAGR